MDGGLFRFVSFRLICKYKPVGQEAEEAVDDENDDRQELVLTARSTILFSAFFFSFLLVSSFYFIFGFYLGSFF